MILSLKEDHKSHLALIFHQPISVLQDFCKLTFDFFFNGPNIQLYRIAAKKLHLDYETIQQAVEGLAYLFVEASRYKLNDLDFRDSVLTAGFSEEQQEVLSAVFEEKRAEISNMLSCQSPDLPFYKDLEWRVEAQVGSRSLLNKVEPQVTLKLTLDDGQEESTLLRVDPGNLVHMTECLEAALRQAESQHCRRVQRRFK